MKQLQVVSGVFLFLFVIAVLVLVFGDGGRASKEAEHQQKVIDASMDQYDRMSKGDLLTTCTLSCERTTAKDPNDLSIKEKAYCDQLCWTAMTDLNAADFKNYVRGLP